MSDVGDRFLSFLFGDAVGGAPWPEERDYDARDLGDEGEDDATDDEFQEIVFVDEGPDSDVFARRAPEPPRSAPRPRRPPAARAGVELRLFGPSGEALRRMRYEGTRQDAPGIMREVLEEVAYSLASRGARRSTLVGTTVQIVDFRRPDPPVSPCKVLGTYAITLVQGPRVVATPVAMRGLHVPPPAWFRPI